jgi:hypothetical protein
MRMQRKPRSVSLKGLFTDRRLLIVGATLLAAAPLVACYGPEYESVHFNR